jgi:hypothetical protein
VAGAGRAAPPDGEVVASDLVLLDRRPDAPADPSPDETPAA